MSSTRSTETNSVPQHPNNGCDGTLINANVVDDNFIHYHCYKPEGCGVWVKVPVPQKVAVAVAGTSTAPASVVGKKASAKDAGED